MYYFISNLSSSTSHKKKSGIRDLSLVLSSTLIYEQILIKFSMNISHEIIHNIKVHGKLLKVTFMLKTLLPF